MDAAPYLDDPPFDFFAANFRVSMGCVGTIPRVTLHPTIPNYNLGEDRLKVFNHTLAVRLTDRDLHLSDGFNGQLKTIRIEFNWRHEWPLLDARVQIHTNVPIIVNQAQKRWYRQSQFTYQYDLKLTDSANFFAGEFSDTLSVRFDTMGVARRNATLTVSVLSDSLQAKPINEKNLTLPILFDRTVSQQVQVTNEIQKLGNLCPTSEELINVHYFADLTHSSPANATTVLINLPGCAFNSNTHTWHRFATVQDITQVISFAMNYAEVNGRHCVLGLFFSQSPIGLD